MCAVPAIAEELERYTALMQQIKEKSKERKALAVHIAELTEDLEEMHSEKALLLISDFFSPPIAKQKEA